MNRPSALGRSAASGPHPAEQRRRRPRGTTDPAERSLGVPMRLLAKFSLIFAAVFGLGLCAAGYVLYGTFQRSARDQVLYNAQVMMETALAMRQYTSEQVLPAVSAVAQPADRSDRADPFRELCESRFLAAVRVFRPQTVPAYAATELFTYLRKEYPDYFYKEASLNPTNRRNRAVEWEVEILKWFALHPEARLYQGERVTPLGRAVVLARPMRAQRACLECHSTPARAPGPMLDIYGSSGGFGWKEGEIIAAQIVSVPGALTVRMANRALRQVFVSLLAVGALTLVFLDLLLYAVVIRPIRLLAARADEMSRGNPIFADLPVRGRDEVATLAAAFNRMQRSVSAAVRLLDNPDAQPPP